MNMDALQEELHNINDGQHQQDYNPFRQYPNQEEQEINNAVNEAMDENGENQEQQQQINNEPMDQNEEIQQQQQQLNNEAGIQNEQNQQPNNQFIQNNNEQQQHQQQDREGNNNRGGRGRRRRPYRAGNPAKRALYKKRNSHYEQAIDTWAKMQAKQIIALSNEFKKNGSRRSN